MAYWLGFCDDAGHYGLDKTREFKAWMKAKFAGKEFVMTVQDRATYRSLRANGYYHGVVLKAAVDETKQDADSIHAFWCGQFLPDEKKRLEFFNKMTGQQLKVTVDARRTSKLTGTAFYDFVEECRLWLQTWLGVTTPDPDPEFWRKRKPKSREEAHA